VQIKAQGLLNAARWIEEQHGREALRSVLHACSPAVRARYTEVTAIDWHPVEEFLEFVEAAERILGGPHANGRIAEAIGAAGARANMKGAIVRFAIWVSQPDSLMRRVPGLWSQYNDEGALSLLSIDDRGIRIEVTGLKKPHSLFCAVLTGWSREVCLALKAISPVSKHVLCRARGDSQCIWEVRYARVEAPLRTGIPPSKE